MKKIFIASDHAGFELKIKLINKFKSEYIFSDLGADTSDSVDYPDYASVLSEKIQNNEGCFGILICGSGIGMSIVANKFKKIRAALCINEEMAKLSRKHNNANILVLGSRLISYEEAIKCFIMFFKSKFEAGRHQARLEKLNRIES